MTRRTEIFMYTIHGTIENPVLTMLRGSLYVSTHYNKLVITDRNEFHCFNNVSLIKQGQFTSSTRTYPHLIIITLCAVQFYI